MKPEINTSSYEFSHGKLPRGYGMWIFRITGTDATYGSWLTEKVAATGKYGEAMKEAVREFKNSSAKIKHVTLIEVQP